ncbi:hypothetical protein Y032_0071g505 [Ancylostoma ceylanicum]|uniref:Uncharacterized protein n=1 Tax=Ancylostoma ceylanicum TaxID=53326 RepID=A0A016TWN3_9BILA|nr:hypothetical protein Y032_0071g505 [Ancylostoma ceylanicum]
MTGPCGIFGLDEVGEERGRDIPRQLTLLRCVVQRSVVRDAYCQSGFRGRTRTKPTAECSTALSTYGKQPLNFLRFSLPSRNFITAYEFNVFKNCEILGNLQHKDFHEYYL